MATPEMITVDGNEAVASVAHRSNEVIAIYPITPSSNMGEFADEWSANGKTNIWGVVPEVIEMQSEGGAAGAVHGSLQAGALTTTFTASQGLLLMIPNMYKIAGELTSYCMHVAARTVATHALSIFGDHSDVMACRQIGFALLAAGSVQEAHDMALIGQAASLRSRIPFLHFFDGFRTSHEASKIAKLSDDDIRRMLDEEAIRAHRERALSPDRPVLRGAAQNPDTFFQQRETVNRFYTACPGIVEETMVKFAQLTGRYYKPFDYFGHPEAERVIVLMGSAIDCARETVEWMVSKGEKVGMVAVRLYRPFSPEHLFAVMPKTVRVIATLDRTKEPGSLGEPLYLDVITALREARDEGRAPWAQDPRVVGGRYGLSSKEFDPAMVRAVFDNLSQPKPRNHFTVGIIDDVTHLSLPFDREFDIDFPDRVQAVFYGLGADGTVSANKNSIKIIGEETSNWAQGYFVYDSKKSGAMTISHLRFGPNPIRSSYLVKRASFVACHQYTFLERHDVLERATPGATFLLNAPFGPDKIWDQLPRELQETILEKRITMYVIDAYQVARETGMGQRINSIMQTCFFAISGVLPRDEAIAKIKEAIEYTYGKKGAEVVKRNFAAVDATLAQLHKVEIPAKATATTKRPPIVSDKAPDLVKRVTAMMIANKGDLLPVSAFPVDGTWPTGTTRWEKRNIALDIPVWDEKICIQCNKCAFVCPHAAIRVKAYPAALADSAPPTFKSMPFKGKGWEGMKYTVQVAPEDCTGCTLCVLICPAKDKKNPRHKSLDMAPQPPLRAQERENYSFFLDLPEMDRTRLSLDLKGSQFMEPLFEYSGACSGCGETPYVKLLTQLFGDRALIGNATGCSSIYGGNLPTTPYAPNRDGLGPAWSNSLFEDNAEFGLGFRLAIDAQTDTAKTLVRGLSAKLGDSLAAGLLEADQTSEKGIHEQRKRVKALRQKLISVQGDEARRLERLADFLVKKSVWAVGGDGWAYDIGFGGLDHVLSMGRDVNILVLDTEVYSNTGGQQSKATPLGAAAKFAMAGKSSAKKDMGRMAMAYGNVYIGQIAFGAKDVQTVKTFLEAESYPGPSLIIAYSHCIAHGYDMEHGLDQQQLLVKSGLFPLYRFDPRRIRAGKPPLQLDSDKPSIKVAEFMQNEARFRMTEKISKDRYKDLVRWAQQATNENYAIYEQLAKVVIPQTADIPEGQPPADSEGV